MDWLKELLKKAGVDEASIDGLVGEAGKEIPKYFVPKSQYNDLSDAKKKADKDVTDRDKQIEDLGKAAGLSDELKKQIETLQNENKTNKDKYDADLKDLTLTNAIKAAFGGKAHDETLAAGLIDKTKLVIDGDKIVGLDEQIKSLQESKGFMFKTEGAQQPNITGAQPAGTGAGAGAGMNADTSKMTYSEMTAHLAKNPGAQI